MALDASGWLNLSERVDVAIRDLKAASREAQAASAAGAAAGASRRKLQQKLREVDDDINRLDNSLSAMQSDPDSFGIGPSEVVRRQDLLSRFRSAARILSDAIEGRSAQARGRSKRKVEETEETERLSSQDLYQEQQLVAKRQDEQLDEILAGVTKLKAMSQDIGTELDLHTQLLSELGDQVDSTDTRIRISADRVRDIEDKEASCWPLFIIVALLVVIVVLIFI
jgi:syntaxin 6